MRTGRRGAQGATRSPGSGPRPPAWVLRGPRGPRTVSSPPREETRREMPARARRPAAARPARAGLTHRELFSPRLHCRRGLKRRGPRGPWLQGPRPHRGFPRRGRRAPGPQPGGRRRPPCSWARGPGGPRRPPPPEPAGGCWCCWCWWWWWPRPPRSCRRLCSHSGSSVAVGRRLARLVVAAAGLALGEAAGSRGAGRGGGLAAEAARAVGLRARSGAPRWILLPQKWPRTSFSRRRTGRGGKGGRGKRVGKVGFRAGPRGSLAFKGARCPFPTYASARDWSATADMGSEGKPGYSAGFEHSPAKGSRPRVVKSSMVTDNGWRDGFRRRSVSEVPAASRERDTMASTKMLLLLLSMALLALSTAHDINDGTDSEDLPEEPEVPQDKEEESPVEDPESPKNSLAELQNKHQGEHGSPHGNKTKDGEEDHSQQRERRSQEEQQVQESLLRRGGGDGQRGQGGQRSQRGQGGQRGQRGRGGRGGQGRSGGQRIQRGRDGQDGQRGGQ
ncbi:uncharacterized protein RBU33_024073 [Hipposideros larvatus]